MGHTYTSLTYHVVFGTKERRRLIGPELKPRLVEYVGGIIRQRGGKLMAMNGAEDHVHLLALLVPKLSVSDQMRDVKSLSSGWVHDTSADLALFEWQEGYGAFTVGKANLDSVVAYIHRQEEHHRRKTFEEEFVEMLERAGVEYDPRYLFD